MWIGVILLTIQSLNTICVGHITSLGLLPVASTLFEYILADSDKSSYQTLSKRIATIYATCLNKCLN